MCNSWFEADRYFTYLLVVSIIIFCLVKIHLVDDLQILANPDLPKNARNKVKIRYLLTFLSVKHQSRLHICFLYLYS